MIFAIFGLLFSHLRWSFMPCFFFVRCKDAATFEQRQRASAAAEAGGAAASCRASAGHRAPEPPPHGPSAAWPQGSHSCDCGRVTTTYANCQCLHLRATGEHHHSRVATRVGYVLRREHNWSLLWAKLFQMLLIIVNLWFIGRWQASSSSWAAPLLWRGRSTVVIRKNQLVKRAPKLPIVTTGGFNYTRQHITIILLAYYSNT